jgi:hypothetical protein
MDINVFLHNTLSNSQAYLSLWSCDLLVMFPSPRKSNRRTCCDATTASTTSPLVFFGAENVSLHQFEYDREFVVATRCLSDEKKPCTVRFVIQLLDLMNMARLLRRAEGRCLGARRVGWGWWMGRAEGRRMYGSERGLTRALKSGLFLA